jgi:hypothetical protein
MCVDRRGSREAPDATKRETALRQAHKLVEIGQAMLRR